MSRNNLLVCLILLMLAASGLSLTVRIEIDAPPIIDATKYHSVMIVPFVDDTEDERLTAGLLASSELRQMFRKDGHFSVVSDEETQRAIDKVDNYNPRSRSNAVEAGKNANANIVIRGSIKFSAFSYSQLGYAPNEGYSVDRGYAPSVGSGTTSAMQQPSQVRYNLTLSITTIDVATGDVIDRQNIQKSSIKDNTAQNIWDITQRRTELNSLLEAAVTEFSNQLKPHKVKRERTLVPI
jgi:hypothetical protein